MAHSSDTKADTVHKRIKHSCQNCRRYFLPKDNLARYVEVITEQTWCSKPCYIELFPQEPKICPCCLELFPPARKTSITCGKIECKRKRKRDSNKKSLKRRRKDPEWLEARRKTVREYCRKKREEDPEFVEKRRIRAREYARKCYKDPEAREELRRYQRERSKDPEIREKRRQYDKKRLEDPEIREKRRQYSREYRLRNKE